MTIQQDGYIRYLVVCDQGKCSANALMSAADPISAAIHLFEKGWGFQLNPAAGPVLALCPLHSQTRAQSDKPQLATVLSLAPRSHES